MRLALFATHPIQYQVPWFRALAARRDLDVRVYYAILPDAEQQGIGFGVPFEWDIPLLEGYLWEVLPNRAATPRLEGFLHSSTPEVHRVLAGWRPDAAVITGWHQLPMLQALRACRSLGIPRIVRGESNAMRPRPWWVRAVHRTLLRQYDGFLAIGRSNRDFYLRNGVAPERIFTGSYFIENERFATQAAENRPKRARLRTAWGIPEGSTCFLYVGKMQPKKRILDLLRALQLATTRGGSVHLLAVGTGELLEEARAFAARHALPVTFAGFLNQSEIARGYAAADCLVLPSDAGETWGLVVNEGMASGLPAIVSDQVGCGPDLITEGETGTTFPCGDAAALADRLLEAARDPDRLRAMGRRASERVQAYSAGAVVEGTLGALEFVTRRRRSSRPGPARAGARAVP